MTLFFYSIFGRGTLKLKIMANGAIGSGPYSITKFSKLGLFKISPYYPHFMQLSI